MSVTIGSLTSDVDATSAEEANSDATSGSIVELHLLQMRRIALDRIIARTQDHDHDD